MFSILFNANFEQSKISISAKLSYQYILPPIHNIKYYYIHINTGTFSYKCIICVLCNHSHIHLNETYQRVKARTYLPLEMLTIMCSCIW